MKSTGISHFPNHHFADVAKMVAQTSKQNVGQHLKNIFEEGELAENSVVQNFFTTAADVAEILEV